MVPEYTVQIAKRRKQLKTPTQQQYLSHIETQENISYQHIYNFKICLVIFEHHYINYINCICTYVSTYIHVYGSLYR